MTDLGVILCAFEFVLVSSRLNLRFFVLCSFCEFIRYFSFFSMVNGRDTKSVRECGKGHETI